MTLIVIAVVLAVVVAYLVETNRQHRQFLEKLEQERREALRARMQEPAGDKHKPKDWSERREYILQRDQKRCVRCGGKAALHVHHKVARSERIDHSEGNLETLCVYCHSEEHGRDFVQAAVISKLARSEKPFRTRFVKRRARVNHECERCRTFIGERTVYYVAKHGISYNDVKLCERCFLAY
jgi:5-methylcytosine-specific restriction endonuclease McrA